MGQDEEIVKGEECTSDIVLDDKLVTWDGPDDPENPKNWSTRRKWLAVISISGFVLMSPLPTTIVSPAIDTIAEELNVTVTVQKPMVMSIFLLGYAIGPMFISPMSEIWGRTRVLQTFNFVFLIFNTACGVARSIEQLLAFRFFAGLFGSCTVGIGAGTLGDLFNAKDRGKAMAIYSIFPLMGQVLGPIAGGFLTMRTSWRWAFYATSIIDGCVQLFGLLFLDESYTPVLLRRKRDRLAKAGATGLYTEHDFPSDSKLDMMRTIMIRPIKLLSTQPIVQVMALYQGYLYGNIYILYSSIAILWTTRYHEKLDIASLHYLALGLGTAFAAEVATHINDRIFRIMTKRNGGKGLPEFRIPIMIPATVILSIGLFWYGWSAEARMFWLMPDIGIALFAAAAYICTVSNNIYIVDTYGRYSASALAATSMLRCLAGFVFPLFSPYAYERIGYGWTSSILGIIALCIGLTGVIFIWKFGHVLRKKSPYCASRDVDDC
ncbi:efflux pump antibiotic resistance protein [Aspergillus niger]|uniref:MFS transporter n=1 Tax=Aspergillus lacticoffeatus (strain CBS 101883) TaxID=1450533 RepID=UPI000D7F3C6D|nr:MFS general substrate transporter [Aspergillus niger CBS 101883]PYH60421.1 MFS general substrate transporter [Aspergillus niger CBS 101883]GJP91876.1 efflux pump antibiotic resistance protein [Aspergillus niger]